MDGFLIWLFGATVGAAAGFIVAGLMHVGSDADDAAEIGEWREP